MVLPRLGGAASVWSVAMVFFQTTLLAGYAYAHLLTRMAPGRPSFVIHLVVMAAACLFLPLSIATGWGQPPEVGEAFWLLGLFAVSIGLPFFALSANGPLLQAWFVRTGHPDAKDPYFLYAASNVGSFLALIAYPIIVEPYIRLTQQVWLWTAGYFLLIVVVAGCGLLMLRSRNRLPEPTTADADETTDAAPPTWRDTAAWIGLAAVPSGLLIAVTAGISTDVASVPLFWTFPLALYLLTFVIVFQRRPFIPHSLVLAVQPGAVLFLAFALLFGNFVQSIFAQIVIHLSVFFVCTLMCHGELARRRPPPRFLTGYYMWLSFGGMLGGILVGIVAPHVFSRIAEYPILLVLTLLCRPGLALPSREQGLSRYYAQYVILAAVGLLMALVMILASVDMAFQTEPANFLSAALLGAGIVLLTLVNRQTVLLFAAVVGALYLIDYYNRLGVTNFLVRNFYGVLSVVEENDGRFRVLYHGSTAQGAQRIRDDQGNLLKGRPENVSEFHDGGGIAQVVDAVTKRVGGPINMGVVGLGTGALACRVHEGSSVTFFELSADIARVARDPTLFNFISECAPKSRIVVGDARLTLEKEPNGSYDLIFIDAFIGAAIPIHLMTREALKMYFDKLKPNGVVAMHISNYRLELATVAAGIAEANGAIMRLYDGGDIEADDNQFVIIPRVAVIARNDADFGVLKDSKFWPVRPRDPRQAVWTDDYSNIFSAIVRRLREEQQSGGGDEDDEE
jgi:hypothetical protein